MGARKRVDREFYKVINGKFVRSLPDPTEETITRTNKNGREVHELIFDEIEGKIERVFKTERTYQQKLYQDLNIYLIDDEGAYALKLNWKSNAAAYFCKQMESIDYNEPVILRLSMKDDKRVFLWVNQNGDGVKVNYTKNEPGNKPDWRPYQVPDDNNPGQKKTMYDRTTELQFFDGLIKDKVWPMLKEAWDRDVEKTPAFQVNESKASEVPAEEEAPEDDLPF